MNYKHTGVRSSPIISKKKETPRELLQTANKRAIEAYTYYRENFKRAERDLKFIAGEHYTQKELKEKEEKNRLALTFNKLPQFVNVVIGSQRSSVDTIKVMETGTNDDELTTDNGKQIKIADLMSDIIRNIEYESNAIDWYKLAFKQALEGGFGYLRVLTKYQDKGFNLDIEIKGIRDKWSVLIDPSAQEPDRSDANWCFITKAMPRDEFNLKYPNKSSDSVVPTDSVSFWGTDDTVTVTEYFRRIPIYKTIVLLTSGETRFKDEVIDILPELKKSGIEIMKERKVKTYKVIWCKISGGDILEDEVEFPTTTIPIVPVLGRELDFKNKKVLKGLISDAIDAQLALNIIRSSAIEKMDSAPLAPFIGSDKAIEGYENIWAEANTTKFSILPFRKGEQPPARVQGAQTPVAELQTAQVLDDDMKSSIGIFNASLGARSNETSGVAIQARQSEGDDGTFEFIDNYRRALRRVGILLTELIPKIYDTERKIRLRSIDGSSDIITVNKIVNNQVTNVLDTSVFNCIISTGASYETKRQQNAQQILDLMRVNPAVAQVGSDLLVKNLDFADSNILAERLEKTIPRNLLSMDAQEKLAKEEPQQQPSPEIQIKQMELEAKQKEIEANIQIEQLKLETAKVNLQAQINKQGITSQQEEQIAEEIASSLVENNQQPQSNQPSV